MLSLYYGDIRMIYYLVALLIAIPLLLVVMARANRLEDDEPSDVTSPLQSELTPADSQPPSKFETT